MAKPLFEWRRWRGCDDEYQTDDFVQLAGMLSRDDDVSCTVAAFTELQDKHSIYEDLSDERAAQVQMSSLLKRHLLGKSSCIALVCEQICPVENKAMTGMNFLCIEGLSEGGNVVGIGPFAIRSDCQGLGLAKKFWDFFYSMSEWKEQDWRHACLVVDSHNTAAFASYIKAGLTTASTLFIVDGKRLLLPDDYSCSISKHIHGDGDGTCSHLKYCDTVCVLKHETVAALSESGLCSAPYDMNVTDDAFTISSSDKRVTMTCRVMDDGDVNACSALSSPCSGILHLNQLRSSIHDCDGVSFHTPFILNLETIDDDGTKNSTIMAYTAGFNIDNHSFSTSKAGFKLLFCCSSLLVLHNQQVHGFAHRGERTPFAHLDGFDTPDILEWMIGTLKFEFSKSTIYMTTPCEQPGNCDGCFACVRKSIRSEVVLTSSFAY